MSTSSFNPIPAGSGAGGDVTLRTNGGEALVFPFAGSILKLSRNGGGKTPTNYGNATRYELDIPAGSTLVGMRITMTVKSASGGSGPWIFALMADDNDWSDAIGWKHANYSFSSDVPYTTRVNGNSYTFTDTPNNYSADDTLSIGSGTLSGDHDFAGIIDDLQDAFDDNPRDQGVGDGVPVALVFTRTNSATANFDFRDQGDATRKPLLEVEYSAPPSGSITAEPEVFSRADARPDTEPLVSAQSEVDFRAAARGTVD